VLCWVVISLLATGGKLAPSEEARQLVANSLLMRPLTDFSHAVLPSDGLSEYDKYCKLSEASKPGAVRGIQDEHGDNHAADGRMGMRMSLAGGEADCGALDFVLPHKVCGRHDVRLSIPIPPGSPYWIPNCLGHKRYSHIKHGVSSCTHWMVVCM
jgi:hypothetical protein